MVMEGTLLTGWHWTIWEDGSGSLADPDWNKMASYDAATAEMEIGNGCEQLNLLNGKPTARMLRDEIEHSLAYKMQLIDFETLVKFRNENGII